MKIDEPERARKLARAILTDIRLYNEEKIASLKGAQSFEALLAGMKDELDEGRELFQSRAEPALHPIFDEVVKQQLGTLWLEG